MSNGSSDQMTFILSSSLNDEKFAFVKESASWLCSLGTHSKLSHSPRSATAAVSSINTGASGYRVVISLDTTYEFPALSVDPVHFISPVVGRVPTGQKRCTATKVPKSSELATVREACPL